MQPKIEALAQLAASNTTASYGTRSWTYDANGNRLTETANGTLQNYYYAANNNRLSNVAQGSVAKRIFTYDAAGNVIQDYRDNTNAYNYTINNAGRIRQMSLNTGIINYSSIMLVMRLGEFYFEVQLF